MAKHEKKKEPTKEFDYASFSIVQIPVDQNSPVPSQRILQTVVKDGETKTYITESSYFRGEAYQNLSHFIELSYERSIMKKKHALTPVLGGRHWLRFCDLTLDGKEQRRINPEKFE